jgi:hypothetical protein
MNGVKRKAQNVSRRGKLLNRSRRNEALFLLSVAQPTESQSGTSDGNQEALTSSY